MKKCIVIGFLATLICFMSVSSGSAGFSDGLVAYYPFTGNASDTSGNGLDGTLIEGEFTKNRFNKDNSALSGYVEIPDNDLLDLTDAFTFSAWLKVEDIEHAFNCWIGKDYTTAFASGITSGGTGDCPAGDDIKRPMVLYIGDQHSAFSLGTNFSCGTDTWYHVAVTFDDASNTAQLYVNGVIVATVTNSGTITPNDFPLGIGRDARYRDKFTGIIDEVRIHNRVLTSAEIEELFNLNNTDDSDGGGGSSGGCFISVTE